MGAGAGAPRRLGAALLVLLGLPLPPRLPCRVPRHQGTLCMPCMLCLLRCAYGKLLLREPRSRCAQAAGVPVHPAPLSSAAPGRCCCCILRSRTCGRCSLAASMRCASRKAPRARSSRRVFKAGLWCCTGRQRPLLFVCPPPSCPVATPPRVMAGASADSTSQLTSQPPPATTTELQVIDQATGAVFSGGSPTKPWTDVCIAHRTGQRISGPLFFGFSDPLTQRAIAVGLYSAAELRAALHVSGALLNRWRRVRRVPCCCGGEPWRSAHSILASMPPNNGPAGRGGGQLRC